MTLRRIVRLGLQELAKFEMDCRNIVINQVIFPEEGAPAQAAPASHFLDRRRKRAALKGVLAAWHGASPFASSHIRSMPASSPRVASVNYGLPFIIAGD
jgi:hypothetical protein